VIQEYRRFTLKEVQAGVAKGWIFASGWFAFSQSVWAWFRKEVGLVRSGSHEELWSGSASSEFEIPLLTVDVEVNSDLRGTERPAVQPLPGDSFEQGEPPQAEELRTDLGCAGAELQSGIDEPNSILVECRLDADGERGLLVGSHAATFALAAAEVKEG